MCHSIPPPSPTPFPGLQDTPPFACHVTQGREKKGDWLALANHKADEDFIWGRSRVQTIISLTSGTGNNFAFMAEFRDAIADSIPSPPYPTLPPISYVIGCSNKSLGLKAGDRTFNGHRDCSWRHSGVYNTFTRAKLRKRRVGSP